MYDMLLGLVAEGATTPSIDWSTIITSSSFDGLINGITTVLPVVVPIGIMIAGIPVVIRLVKKIGTGKN